MKLPLAPRRTLAAVSAAGSLLGLVMMTPLLLQGSRYSGIDQLALLAVVLLYAYGTWSAIQAFKSKPNWQTSLAMFWLAQVPAISSSVVTFTLSCGAGAWLYVRIGPLGLGGGAAAYFGSAYQWSYLVTKPEVHLGVNVLAGLVAAWLLLGQPQASVPQASPNAA